MFPFLLYIITGLATGYQVVMRLMLAVWGRQPHPLEFVSFVGSLALIGAAFTSLFKPRIAAWVAFLATLTSWAFYGPALVQTYQAIVSDRELAVKFVQWKPGPAQQPLREGSWFRLTSDERAQLDAIGLTGQLTVVGGVVTGRGKRSSAVIVMDRQLDSAVELPQPDGTQVIYVLTGEHWRMYPSDAPTLGRTIRLEIASYTVAYTLYDVELASGGRQGGSAFYWPELDRGTGE